MLDAKKKYRLIEIETPRQQDQEEEYENPYIVITKAIVKLIFKAAQFGLYIVITILQWIINLLKIVFLQGFEPFENVKNNGNNFLNRIAKKEINKEKIKFSTEKMTQHTYEFERSMIYNAVYKELQTNLKDFADNGVVINQDIYKDILQKINIMTVEVEKKALEEGYSYAAYTKYRFNDQEEIYNNFVEFKVMRGEGHGKNDTKYRASQD